MCLKKYVKKKQIASRFVKVLKKNVKKEQFWGSDKTKNNGFRPLRRR